MQTLPFVENTRTETHTADSHTITLSLFHGKKEQGFCALLHVLLFVKSCYTLWCNMAYDETSIECMVAEESLYCVDLGTWGQVSGRAVYVRVK